MLYIARSVVATIASFLLLSTLSCGANQQCKFCHLPDCRQGGDSPLTKKTTDPNGDQWSSLNGQFNCDAASFKSPKAIITGTLGNKDIYSYQIIIYEMVVDGKSQFIYLRGLEKCDFTLDGNTLSSISAWAT